MASDRKLKNAQAKAIDMDTLGKMLGMFDEQDKMQMEQQRLGLQERELSQRSDLAQQQMENQRGLASAENDARREGSKSALLNARANLLQLAPGQDINSPIMKLIAAADPEFAKILGNQTNPDAALGAEAQAYMKNLQNGGASATPATAGTGNNFLAGLVAGGLPLPTAQITDLISKWTQPKVN